MKHQITIHFTSGSYLIFASISEESTQKLVSWYDNIENTESFKIDTKKEEITTLLRRENITYMNIK